MPSLTSVVCYREDTVLNSVSFTAFVYCLWSVRKGYFLLWRPLHAAIFITTCPRIVLRSAAWWLICGSPSHALCSPLAAVGAVMRTCWPPLYDGGSYDTFLYAGDAPHAQISFVVCMSVTAKISSKNAARFDYILFSVQNVENYVFWILQPATTV